jgi:hypothetical protein
MRITESQLRRIIREEARGFKRARGPEGFHVGIALDENAEEAMEYLETNFPRKLAAAEKKHGKGSVMLRLSRNMGHTYQPGSEALKEYALEILNTM